MSIAKRIAEAIEKMAQDNAEGALLPVCATVDASVKKHFGKGGRSSLVCVPWGLREWEVGSPGDSSVKDLDWIHFMGDRHVRP